MNTNRNNDLASLPPAVRFAFAPLVKRAFGLALGVTTGLVIFVLTLWTLWLAAPGEDYIGLLCQYFTGYDVSLRGAVIGAVWGFWTGFVMGWCCAALRNFCVAVWIFTIRARAQLKANRDFLDHI